MYEKHFTRKTLVVLKNKLRLSICSKPWFLDIINKSVGNVI